ncbi:MAG: NADH-quinone oxidoreductase subunit C [Acidobacteriaceae bacterium]|nr:NADH-quinone oxidoreductase subunit C [Acidobacteriaceae bacterium]
MSFQNMPSPSPEAKDVFVANYPGDSAAFLATGYFVNAKFELAELTLEVAPEFIVDACRALQADGYNFFEDCTCVDWYPTEPRFQVTYSLLSHQYKQRIRVIARLSSQEPVIASITSVWPAANFYEREVFDLFGVRFTGHPRLTRIMMPDNWNGHPLRKDYPVEGYR